MKKTRYCDAQILGILKQAESGVPVSEQSREDGMGLTGLKLHIWPVQSTKVEHI